MSNLIICFWFALSILAYRWWHRRGLHLPPGPKGWPILGIDISHGDKHIWLRYADWAARYGDVVYLETFGQPSVILNSAKAATDLLEKRSSNYSDRPSMPMANDLAKWDWDFAHMKYSDKWRIHRRTFHQYFQPREVASYESVQLRSTSTMLQAFLQSPEDFTNHIRHNAGSIILKLVYGYNVQSHQDGYVELANEAMKGLSQVVHAGSFLVDFLPILKYVPSWLPGAKFKRQAKEWSRSSLALKNRPFDLLKTSIANGTAIPSFVTENLYRMKREQASPEMEEVIKNCAGIAYLAGSDTTVSVILSFILAMVLHPDIQARAQAELDRVVGRSRLPDFRDRPDLPYVEALLSEALRWLPVTPLAVPHSSIRGDEYNGYYIPPGSTVIPNVWAILHDPVSYPDPSTFKPERFLKEDDKHSPPHPANYAFGFGRRICPGRYLAINSVWIVIASILSVFSITKAVDDNGNEITPLVDSTDGTVTHPVPFKCTIKPRSSDAVEVIKHGYDSV